MYMIIIIIIIIIIIKPVNMLEPICMWVGSAGKHWPEAGRMILAHWLSSGPDPFGQNLAQSARTKSDLGWFAQYYPGRLWKNGTKSKKWEPGSWLVASCSLLSDQTSLAKPWPGHLDQIRVSFAQYDPAFFGKTELKRMWDVGLSITVNTIQPVSGCMLAISKMLPYWIRQVYWECISNVPNPLMAIHV